MRTDQSIFAPVAAGVTAFALVAAVLLLPEFARASEATGAGAPPSCTCPDANKPLKPKFAGIDVETLDEGDAVAALQSLQFALVEVADGASYVWHRANGRLSGVVRPTRSFKSADGAICRHVLVVLSTAAKTRQSETVACRQPTGQWKLDG